MPHIAIEVAIEFAGDFQPDFYRRDRADGGRDIAYVAHPGRVAVGHQAVGGERVGFDGLRLEERRCRPQAHQHDDCD